MNIGLVRHLKAKSPDYFGKFLEVRDEVKGWLTYTVESFPHYTRHTIEHSDQIIRQLSHLLFRDTPSRKPVLNLTGTEAYVLIMSALLHDAGMVVSDEEKAKLLSDSIFQNWIREARSAQWDAITALRDSSGKPGESVRHFLADVETRRLIAEYVRRQHHERAYGLLKQHDLLLGRVSFGDHQLEEAIGVVCLGHGLTRAQLDDSMRYPLLREIRGELVNLRRLAVLFRLGDLLDMSVTRACPLLMNAANPLPTDSHSHWTQYKRISHFLVTPREIQITAECQTPEEHRVLRDWCQWIVDEVQQAPALLASPAEAEWLPPKATLEGRNATIQIRAAPTARYRAVDWRFELDENAVCQRLIADIYDSPLSFVRELIQNALDAMRCRLYSDLASSGYPAPRKPTSVPEEIRRKYRLSISSYVAAGGAEQGKEKHQVIEFDDSGIGMDEETIRKFFLQIGRSYYASEPFRARYNFAPVSMFGVGFLSVFAACDFVEVETLKHEPIGGATALCLKLHGPRNYVILENSDRSSTGTKIRVHLRSDIRIPDETLIDFVRTNCARTEFPIDLRTAAGEETVVAESATSWHFDVPDKETAGARYVLRSHFISDDVVEGYLLVPVHLAADGHERWISRYKVTKYIRNIQSFLVQRYPIPRFSFMECSRQAASAQAVGIELIFVVARLGRHWLARRLYDVTLEEKKQASKKS